MFNTYFISPRPEISSSLVSVDVAARVLCGDGRVASRVAQESGRDERLSCVAMLLRRILSTFAVTALAFTETEVNYNFYTSLVVTSTSTCMGVTVAVRPGHALSPNRHDPTNTASHRGKKLAHMFRCGARLTLRTHPRAYDSMHTPSYLLSRCLPSRGDRRYSQRQRGPRSPFATPSEALGERPARVAGWLAILLTPAAE